MIFSVLSDRSENEHITLFIVVVMIYFYDIKGKLLL